MTTAFVLIETETGKTGEVTSALRQIAGVKSVEPVTGAYDVIAVIEEKSPSDIGELLVTRVQPTRGINRLVTCLT